MSTRKARTIRLMLKVSDAYGFIQALTTGTLALAFALASIPSSF